MGKKGKHMPKSAKITSAALLLLIIIASVFLFNGTESGSRYQSTEDAYVHADFTMVAPRINGQIDQVPVSENQAVQQGDLLFTIDDRDFVIQVENAAALRQSMQASHDSISRQLQQQESVIAQAKASVDADLASLELSKLEYERYRNLADDGSGSKQDDQKATANYKIAQATLARDRAQYQSETQRLPILQAELHKARAAIDQAQAALDSARLNLSYCRIIAPIDGVVSQQGARLGAYVTSGAPVLAIVPLQDVYIEAYYRETQLANIRVGQKVAITVDARPGLTWQGEVTSLGPASNASFSAIAPHSTSSNFTKIVQRLPLRISISDENKALLKVGMSVIPEIDTGSD